MRLYLSGAITSDPDGYVEKFGSAAARLREVGYDVVNPAELDGVAVEDSWLAYMRRDIPLLVECDGVAFLDDWTLSRGARVEVTLADGLGIPARPLACWLREAPVLLRV